MTGIIACGKKKQPVEEKSPQQKEITIWAWDENFNVKAANRAKIVFQKEYPDVNVNVVTMAQDEIVEKLNTGFMAESYEYLPDIVLIEDYKIKKYLLKYPDEFTELSDIAVAEDFADYKTGSSMIDGKLYGIPFDSGVAATFYRIDMIEQAGYTREDMENLTWDKYIEIGKAVKEKCGIKMCTLDPDDLGLIRMMMQSAGTWYTDEPAVADNQGLKDAIRTYKKLVEADITKGVCSWTQYIEAINREEVASIVTGCWIMSSIESEPDQHGKWAVAKFPKMSENENSVNASSLGGSGWYVLKNTGNEELAKKFLAETFASNVDLMNILAKDIQLISTLKGTEEADNYQNNIEYFGNEKILKEFVQWTNEVPKVDYGIYTYEVEDIFVDAVQEIIRGVDMDSVLEDYQIQVDAITGAE